MFKKRFISFLTLLLNKVPNLHNPQGLKLLRSLRLSLSHLCDQNFKHNFLDTIIPLCILGSDIEGNSLFFFVYNSNVLEERTTLLSKISEINGDILTCTDYKIVENLLFGKTFFNLLENSRILNATIIFIIS